jgi:hypothetical protein
MKLKQQVEDYVHEFFKKTMCKKAFSYVIYPVPGQEDWPKTGTRVLILLCSEKSEVESKLKEGNLHLRFQCLETVQEWEPLHVATAVKLAIGTLLALLT